MTPAEGATIAACAEAMYAPGTLMPALDWRLVADWDLIDYITGQDALFGAQKIGLGDRVYYGFLARSKSNPLQFIAPIRGTERLAEWIEDAEAVLIDDMHAGFVSIYNSMKCGQPDADLADGISARVPIGATVTCIGHSLGAPLAAYEQLALVRMNVATKGLFYAMPKPGDGMFAEVFDKVVRPQNYMVYNYLRDIVPRLPIWLPLHPFERLNNRVVIRPKDSSAKIDNTIVSNHQAEHYAALLAGLSTQGNAT